MNKIKSNFYEILDLPKLPNELAQLCLSLENPIIDIDQDPTARLTMKDFTKIELARWRHYTMPHELEDWVAKNIKPVTGPRGREGCGVQKFTSQSSVYAVGPHIDRKRDRSLNYIIDCGGDAVDTVWYQEYTEQSTFPIYRNDGENYYPKSNLKYLNELDRARFLNDTWALLETTVIHSVLNITGTRIMITLSLNDDEIDAFCEMHTINTANKLWQKYPKE